MIEKNDIIALIRSNLPNLPLSFRYLSPLKEEAGSGSFSSVHYKPDTVGALQTNDEPVGVYYKPIGRAVTSPMSSASGRHTTHDNDREPDSSDVEQAPLPYDKIFRLFACAQPVRGAARSIICDLQRQFFHFIPNDFYHILTTDTTCTFGQIVEKYGEENAETLADYFQFFIEHEYGFWCDHDELAHFPPLSDSWYSPLAISNSIIDVDAASDFDIYQILDELDALGCAAVQIRFFCPQPLDVLGNIARSLQNKRIKSVDFWAPYLAEASEEAIAELVNTNSRINNLVFYNAPENILVNSLNKNLSRIMYTTDRLGSEMHCGAVDHRYFMVNMELYTESRHFNSCLNRKISVDKKGQIKNCPSMLEHFGNICDTSLRTALNTAGFTDKWSITKDAVGICRDCEFRYICTDCRAYTIDDDPLGKSAKCTYDPYTAEWA